MNKIKDIIHVGYQYSHVHQIVANIVCPLFGANALFLSKLVIGKTLYLHIVCVVQSKQWAEALRLNILLNKTGEQMMSLFFLVLQRMHFTWNIT